MPAPTRQPHLAIMCAGLLALALGAHPPQLLADPAPAPAATSIAASEESLASLKATARDLKRVARQEAKDRARKAGPLTPAEVLALTGKRDPDKILAWVREHISFEPYSGAVRSPNAVLAARRANAPDAARLLHALYTQSGMKVRFVWGELDETQALVLLTGFSGESMIERKGAPIKDASFNVHQPRHLEPITTHAWVEVEHAGRFKDADPFTGLALEATRGIRKGAGDVLPEMFEATLGLEVIARKKDGREVGLIRYAGTIDDFTFRPVSLGFVPEARAEKSWRAVLKVGATDFVAKEYFSATELDALQLRFDMKVGRRQQIWTQPLYTRAKSSDSIFDYEQLHLSLAVIPGWTSDGQLARVGGKALGDLMDEVEAWAKLSKAAGKPLADEVFAGQTRDILERTTAVFPYVFARHLDRLTQRLAHGLGVKLVMQQPRVILTSVVRDGDRVSVKTDIQGDRLEAIAALGTPDAAASAFSVLYGRIEDEVEGELTAALTGAAPLTTSAVFKSAIRGRVPVRTLHADNLKLAKKLDEPEGLGEMLAQEVRKRGVIFLLPEREVKLGGLGRTSWWEVDPVTGGLHSGSWQGLLNIAHFTPAGARIDQGKSMVALTSFASRQLLLWMSTMASSEAHDGVICRAADDARTIGRALCATRAAKPLPELQSCLVPSSEAALEAATGTMIDPMAAAPLGCDESVQTLRCGAVTARAFLYGELIAVPKVSDEELATWELFTCSAPAPLP